MSHKVLVTGGQGQLGRELARAAWPDGWQVVAVGRDALDLADPGAIARIVAAGHDGAPWTAIVNAAAYTAVDKAESDPVAAWQVNALAPAALALACRTAGIPLIQLSTDYVFSGDRPIGAEGDGWGADDHPAPLGVYGASKLGGELAVRTSGARYVIVRTAWLVSVFGHNFVKTMLRLGGERDILRVVGDQFGGPTSAADLARAVVTIAVRLAEDPAAPTGTFHFTNAGATSWAGFATAILQRSADRGGPESVVQPITTADYPTPAPRPANSVLSNARIEEAYGVAARPWQAALDDILDELIGPISPPR